MLHGFLNIDKPAGMTSHDVVARVRRLAGQKRVGHGGTLDPAATGVLPVALGEATRLLEFLVEGRKRYVAEIRLGVVTTTDDREGDIVAEQPVPDYGADELRQALEEFTGTIQQVPPMYSAIQVGGRRLYDLARAGTAVDVAPREVVIDRIELVDWATPRLIVDVTCGKGTYIRALARDLGQRLHCGAHLQTLRRTAVGPLTIERATPLQALLDEPATLPGHVLPPAAALAHLPRVEVEEQDAQRLRNGLPLASLGIAGEIVVAYAAGEPLALLRYDEAVWRPFKVFAWR